MNQTQLSPEVIQAYLETNYQAGDILLQVGLESRRLQAAMAEYGVTGCVFITAWNPYSQANDDVSNAKAQDLLRSEVGLRGWPAVEGFGKHPSNDWPAEASLLVFGPGREEARALGRRFGQNAVVWTDYNAVPQLELLQ